MTLRASVAVIALFALDFSGVASVVHHKLDPLSDLIAPVVFFGPFALLFALIYLYVPPRLDEVLTVILILVVLALLIVPALRHS